jgi:phosphopantetheinyl transferase
VIHGVYREPGAAEPPDPPSAWLTEAERERAAAFRTAKRRGDWLRGRHAVKTAAIAAIRHRFGVAPPMVALQVDAEPSGAPFVRLARDGREFLGFAPGARLPVAVSISHSAAAVFCLAAADGRAVGADLERVEPRSEGFVQDFFSGQEQALAGRAGSARDLMVAAIWAAKEAVLKVVGLGLTVDSREVVCLPETGPCPAPNLEPAEAGWCAFRVVGMPRPAVGRCVRGWWRPRGPFVQAIGREQP